MPETAEQPNILVIMADEHDPAVMGCYGDDTVDTGHLDGLADRGVTFENGYANSPLCGPSRLSFTAGQYVSRCEAWANDCWLPGDENRTLPNVLNEAGYKSLLAGKMHYDATRRYGFTELFDGPQNQKHKTAAINRRSPTEESVNTGWWDNRSTNFYVGEDARHFAWDREVTEECSSFLRDRDPDDDPFFLLAGSISPHFPLVAPFEYYRKYHDEVPRPEIPEGFFHRLPTNYQQIRRAFGVAEEPHTGDPEGFARKTGKEVDYVNNTGDKIKFARELYWAFVDWFDDQVGRLLDAFADSAVADNTVVIYTSDHGENKGDHGMWWKNCMYDHSASVPLIVSWPERWAGGQRRAEVCSLVDLVGTITELSGADVPEQWDGDSMVDLLDDPDADWKDVAVSEYYAHTTVTGFTMYREGRYKYVYHARHDDEFGPEVERYDMQEDAGEFQNLAHRDEYQDIREELHAGMLTELGEHPDDIEQRARRATEAGYDRN